MGTTIKNPKDYEAIRKYFVVVGQRFSTGYDAQTQKELEFLDNMLSAYEQRETE